MDSVAKASYLIAFEENEQQKIGTKLPSLIYYLMETSWLKPTPINVTKGRSDSKSVNTVPFMNDERYDFALDSKTYLPLQVKYYYFAPASKKNLVNEILFSDYKNFDEIMMPTKLKYPNENGIQNLVINSMLNTM